MVFEEVLARAQQLPQADQARLIAHLAAQLQRSLVTQPQPEGTPQEVFLPADDAEWDAFLQLMTDCVMETGVESLAHWHDHHLYGKAEDEVDL